MCPTPTPPIVFQAYVRAVHEQTARLPRLEHALQDQVKSWRLHPVVEALQALRGVQCTVAVTMVAEIGDLTRVETPRELMKCLGLIPSAYSSGEPRRQGSLTKAGNAHARRALVEGAWASRDPAKVSRHLPRRRETRPKLSKTAVGKPRSGGVNATAGSSHEANTPTWSRGPWHGSWPDSCGPLPSRCR